MSELSFPGITGGSGNVRKNRVRRSFCSKPVGRLKNEKENFLVCAAIVSDDHLHRDHVGACGGECEGIVSEE